MLELYSSGNGESFGFHIFNNYYTVLGRVDGMANKRNISCLLAKGFRGWETVQKVTE